MKTMARRSVRLPEYDYSQEGAYFVTICVQGKELRLGTVENGEMRLNRLGKLVSDGWKGVETKYNQVHVLSSCVMPNHIHAIIVIHAISRGEVTSPIVGGETPPLHQPTLGQIVAFYKYETTKQINAITQTPGTAFWQRNYYERVIRNERELEAIHDYIATNPANWDKDEYR